MNPVAFEIGFITVYWYGIMASLAMFFGFLISQHFAHKYGIDDDTFGSLIMIYVPSIVVGARIAYVVSKLDYFVANPSEIIRVDHGGLGSHGAIIAMLIVGAITARRYKLNFWDIADAMAPVLPLATIFIRIGNFTNGELYGLPTTLPWGVVFPGTSGPVHPSMLYEGVLHIFLLALTIAWANGRKHRGDVFLRMMLVVSIGRLLVDFTRERGPGVLMGLMLTQVMALAFILACGFLIIYRGHGNIAPTTDAPRD